MDSVYSPMLPETQEDASLLEKHADSDYTPAPSQHSRTALMTAIKAGCILSLLLNTLLVSLLATGFLSYRQSGHGEPCNGLRDSFYFPAQSAVKYEYKVFSGVGEKSVYSGPPSNETDLAWHSLFNGLSRLSKAEAAMLPNHTEAIADEEGQYVVQLDISHNLHCLDAIRRAVNTTHYGAVHYDEVFWNGAYVPFNHIDHCINIIRESLMCNADLSAIVWQWEPAINQTVPRFDSLHVCRNWNAITEWADNHKLLPYFNTHISSGQEGGTMEKKFQSHSHI